MWDFFWNLYKDNKGRFLLVLSLVGVIYFFKSEFYKDYFKSPIFTFENGSGMDKVIADIELGEGEIIVIPVLTVKYEDEIVCTAKVSNYYNKNYAVLQSSSEERSLFQLKIDDRQREKIALLIMKSEDLLHEEIDNESLEVYIVYLMHVNYQNKKSNRVESRYWFFTD